MTIFASFTIVTTRVIGKLGSTSGKARGMFQSSSRIHGSRDQSWLLGFHYVRTLIFQSGALSATTAGVADRCGDDARTVERRQLATVSTVSSPRNRPRMSSPLNKVRCPGSVVFPTERRCCTHLMKTAGRCRSYSCTYAQIHIPGKVHPYSKTQQKRNAEPPNQDLKGQTSTSSDCSELLQHYC